MGSPILPNTWPVNIGTNLSRGGGVGDRRRRVPIVAEGNPFSTLHAFNNCDTPNPSIAFYLALNLDIHPTTIFLKRMHCNPTILIADHKNKWEKVGLMDNYYVVWSDCHSISRIWSNNQHQGDHSIPYHNWQHPALHMPIVSQDHPHP